MHWILAVVLFWLQLKLKNCKMEFWWTSHAFLHHRFLHETCGFQWGNSKHGIQNKIWVGKSSYLLDNSDLIISVQNLNYSPVVTIGIWANDLQISTNERINRSSAGFTSLLISWMWNWHMMQTNRCELRFRIGFDILFIIFNSDLKINVSWSLNNNIGQQSAITVRDPLTTDIPRAFISK